MKFVINIHVNDAGRNDHEDICSIKGSNTLDELIKQIAEQTFTEKFLRLYTEKDIEREFDLLQYWTEEQRATTLSNLGFQEDVEYHIDADNYPEANLSPVTIHTDKTWYIVKSGSTGPAMKVVPGMKKFRIDFNSWRGYLPGKRTKRLLVLVDPKPKLDKNRKVQMEDGNYIAKKFKFPEQFEELYLDFEPGTNIPQLKINDQIIQSVDKECTFPLINAPQGLSKMRVGPPSAAKVGTAAGIAIGVLDFFLAAGGV